MELLGHYGGDESSALSAWTSTSRDLTEEKRARIPQMLKSLAENGHETPFEKSALHFLVTCDTATHIHLLKHRHLSINAESARYKELKEDKFYVPGDWGSAKLVDEYLTYIEQGYRLYHRLLKQLEPELGRKRAKESARFVLPYANQLTLDVMFNFRSFVHFQRLRNDEHAQKEVREVAQKMLALVKELPEFEYSLVAFKL